MTATIKNIANKARETRSWLIGKLEGAKGYWKLKVKYPGYYKFYSLFPIISNKVVFIENKSPELSNSFQQLNSALHKRQTFTIVESYLLDGEVNEQAYKKRCVKMIKEVATARCVFVNDSSNIVGCIPFRKGTDIVQVWHACGAYKKWGFSNAKGKFGADIKGLLKYPWYADYTMVTVSSEEVAWAYAEAFNIPLESGKVKATGVSRTDIFFDSQYTENAYKSLNAFVPEAEDKQIILYAPTYRGGGEAPNNMSLEFLKEKLGDKYILLLKHHPFVKNRPKISDECKSFAFDVSGDLSIEELLCTSDICITDYSSIVFEYSLQEKPIIFYAFDIDEYVDWRGFYYNFEDFVPGPIIKTDIDLAQCILSIDEYDIGKVKAFRQKFMDACDGRSTERIIDSIFANDVR